MSAFRSLRQLAVASTRALAARPAPLLARQSVVARVALTPATRAFSVSARRFGQGASDVTLSQKLGEELQYEKDTAKSGVEPEFLKTFRELGIWQVEDVEGNDEVTITRKFGSENIRLMFSIADIQSGEEEFDQPEEEAANEEDTEEEDSFHPYPIRASFSITKTNSPGALNVDTMCQDGSFIVDNISFYSEQKLGTELTVEADWKRRGLYIGPQFDSLDVGVQEEFEKFLHERGIDAPLALFVGEYADYKEQKEYTRWLMNVKKFIDDV